MPSVEKTEKTKAAESAPAEKAPDFAELQKQKEALFKEIEGDSLKFNEAEKMNAVGTVSNYSIKDGFELARRLGLKGDGTFVAMTYQPVIYKNKKFFSAFGDYLAANEKYVSGVDSNYISSGMRRMERILDSELEDVKWSMDYQADQIAPIAQKINAYYSHFIRNRRLASPEAPADARTQVEMAGEHHLKSAEAVLKESYYTGPIREMLGLQDQEKLEAAYYYSFNAKTGPFINAETGWALMGDLIDRETLDKIFIWNKIDVDSPEAKKVLRHARYTPSQVVFETRKEGVEDGLVKQIKQSLIKRGFKEDEFEIAFNKEKGEYEVISKKEESVPGAISDKESGKENLREVEDLPKEVEYKNSQYYLHECSVLDGQVYKLYRDHHSGGSILSDSRGNAIDAYSNIRNVQKVGNHVVFEAKGKIYNDRTVCVVDSSRELYNEKFSIHIGKSFIENHSHIYWVGTNLRSFAIIEDDKVYADLGVGVELQGNLEVIEGKLTYITRQEKERKAMLNVGNERFGPYDEIKLCENSKDKLVFYAKKGDEHIVYVDGVEKELKFLDYLDGSISREDPNLKQLKVQEVVRNENGDIFIHFKTIKEDIIYYNIEKNGNQDVYYADEFSNLQIIDGKISWLSYDKDKRRYLLQRLNRGTIPIKVETGNNTVVDFKENIFVSDGKKILRVKFDKTDFNEMSFGGPVELVNSGGRLFIIESLPDKKRIWEYSEELKLNEAEQKDLDLANAVAKEDLESIENYFDKYYEVTIEELAAADAKGKPLTMPRSAAETIKAGIKGALEQSKGFVGAVNQTIKEMPELFLDTLRAKDDKPTEYLMTQMFYYMFPEAQAKRERAIAEQKRNRSNPWNIFGGRGGGSGLSTGSGRGGREGMIDYDAGMGHLASVDEAGYYEMMKADREVLRLREPLPPSTFITQGLFGNYAGGGWKKVNVPISQEVSDPAKETTFEFTDEKASQNINLPKIANAKIITERLKGITAKNTEVPVKILEENNLGEVRIDKGKDAKRVSYSQTYSEMPTTMAEITADDYGRFRKDFEKSFGDVMTRPIGDIGDELDIFVRGLNGKSPREQVIAIQEFCYEYGYYNLDNAPRDTDSFEERLSIMEGRMDELKSARPELAGKKYAGICTDFATLTAGLLRKAGFVSGIASGFVPEEGSTSVKTSRAHAVAYVLWPGSSGNNMDSGLRRNDKKEGRNDKTSGNDRRDNKPDLIIVDGTPSSITPRIAEQEKKAAAMGKELSIDAEKELAELEQVLKTMDAEAIKKLSNGKLEQTLNHILYGVKQSHVDVMSRVLNASRYAGFDILEMARGNLEDQIEFRKFLEEEIYKEKSTSHENRERRGEELFKLMLDFTRRFEKDRNVKGKQEALDVLETVFDTASKYLDPVEQRSAAAIVTYLRAKRMR